MAMKKAEKIKKNDVINVGGALVTVARVQKTVKKGQRTGYLVYFNETTNTEIYLEGEEVNVY